MGVQPTGTASLLWTPPQGYVAAAFGQGLLADWRLDRVTGVADGAGLSSIADQSGNGNPLVQAVAGNRPIYRTSAWPTDGGPCAEMVAASPLFATCNALAARFGAGALSGPVTVAALIRMTGTSGCVWGTGAMVGNAQIQGYVNNGQPAIVATDGAITASWNAPGWLPIRTTANSAGDRDDTLIVWSFDPSALAITGAAANGGDGAVRLTLASTSSLATRLVKSIAGVGGTTEANGVRRLVVVDATHVDLYDVTGAPVLFTHAYISGGIVEGSGWVWVDGELYAKDTGRDVTSAYDSFGIGAFNIGAIIANPADFYLRRASVWGGTCSAQRLAAIVDTYQARYLIRYIKNYRGDSITAGNGVGHAYPFYCVSPVGALARQSSNCLPHAPIFSTVTANGGRAWQDLGPVYVNGESASNTFVPSDIAGGVDVAGIGGVDENGQPNYDVSYLGGKAVSRVRRRHLAALGHHEIARGLSAEETVRRAFSAIDLARLTAPTDEFVLLDVLPAVQPGFSDSVRVAVNAAMAAGWRSHAQGFIPWSRTPGFGTATPTNFQDEAGVLVHPNDTGAAALGAAVDAVERGTIDAETVAAYVSRLYVTGF